MNTLEIIKKTVAMTLAAVELSEALSEGQQQPRHISVYKKRLKQMAEFLETNPTDLAPLYEIQRELSRELQPFEVGGVFADEKADHTAEFVVNKAARLDTKRIEIAVTPKYNPIEYYLNLFNGKWPFKTTWPAIEGTANVAIRADWNYFITFFYGKPYKLENKPPLVLLSIRDINPEKINDYQKEITNWQSNSENQPSLEAITHDLYSKGLISSECYMIFRS